MRKMMPIEVTFRNGTTVRTEVDAFNLTSYLAKLDMDLVTGIKYGADVAPSFPVTVVKPVDVDLRNQSGHFFLDMHKDDKRFATAKFTPVQFNDFGLRIMQQAHYEFRAMVQRDEEKNK